MRLKIHCLFAIAIGMLFPINTFAEVPELSELKFEEALPLEYSSGYSYLEYKYNLERKCADVYPQRIHHLI